MICNAFATSGGNPGDFRGGRLTPRAFFLAGTAFLVMSASCVSCHRNPEPRPPEPPVDVSPDSLVRLYRDTPEIANTAYTEKRIRCRLTAGAWKPTQKEIDWAAGIGWFAGRIKAPPVLVFAYDGAVPAEDGGIEIVGTCRGVVRDGRRRGPGLDWYILVDNCAVTALPASP